VSIALVRRALTAINSAANNDHILRRYCPPTSNSALVIGHLRQSHFFRRRENRGQTTVFLLTSLTSLVGKTVGACLVITHSTDKKAGDCCLAAHFDHCGEKGAESMNSADVKTP